MGFTGEAILSPTSAANRVELEFELNLGVLQAEQTRGWVSSDFDIVDQFGPAERPHHRAYAQQFSAPRMNDYEGARGAPSSPLRSHASLRSLCSQALRPSDSPTRAPLTFPTPAGPAQTGLES